MAQVVTDITGEPIVDQSAGDVRRRSHNESIHLEFGDKKGRLGAADVTDSVRDYLNARFGLLLGSLTPDEAADILTSKGVRPETSAKLRTILRELENAIYTGKGTELREVGVDLPKLIKQIEREITEKN